jgi:hypothetical protein
VQPLLPRYATQFMPPGLTEEHALQQALLNSAPHPPTPPPPLFNPWAAPPPPPPPAEPTYVPPAANWSWKKTEFVVLDYDDGE